MGWTFRANMGLLAGLSFHGWELILPAHTHEGLCLGLAQWPKGWKSKDVEICSEASQPATPGPDSSKAQQRKPKYATAIRRMM